MLIRKTFYEESAPGGGSGMIVTLAREVASPQTVSKLMNDLDEAVWLFHQVHWDDDWALDDCRELCEELSPALAQRDI